MPFPYKRRTSNLFDPKSSKPYRLSRTRLENFLRCPRCFYLDRRLGIDQPPGYPFSLNNAVDLLLKKEFDFHRAKGEPHPMMKRYKIDAVPFDHEKMDYWRDALRGGVEYVHEPSGFMLTGGVDDIWVNSGGELHVVDYKATSKEGAVGIDADWQEGYRNQMEIYQWLLRQNGFKVSDTGYFVYVNGRQDREAFDAKLEFDVAVIPYKGTTDWIEGALMEAKACLSGGELPASRKDCAFCGYREAAQSVELPKKGGGSEHQNALPF